MVRHTNEWKITCMVEGGSTISVGGEDHKENLEITISENGGPRDDVRTAKVTMSVNDWRKLMLDVHGKIVEDDPRG